MVKYLPIILKSDSKTAVSSYIKKTFPGAICFEYEPEKTEYSINQIRSLQKDIIYSHTQLHIYRLNNFDLSTTEAQNALLKLLEDPPPLNKIILVVNNEYLLLETIRSRALLITLNIIPKLNNPHVPLKYSHIFQSQKYNVLGNSDFIVKTKQDAVDKINELISEFRYVNSKNTSQILTECVATLKSVYALNINPQLALDHLLIFIIKLYTIK